jgi:hypothetical protein
VFFKESLAEAFAQDRAKGARFSPPNIGAVAAFKTSNGSMGGGGGYFGTSAGDRFRYMAEVAQVDLNLDFYTLRGIPREFSMNSPFLKTDGMARIGKSDWFAGARYNYFGGTIRFAGDRPSPVSKAELKSHVGRLALLLDYDSRDNILTPSRGSFAELDVGIARPWLGSSTSFESLLARDYTYVPLGSSFVLGLRADGTFTRGRVPFYARPYVVLRGVPAMRYQGRDSLVAETELRWNVTRRWSLLAFGGAGKAYGGRVTFSSAETAAAGGVGFRYLIARKLGMYVGMDAARGPEDTAVYFQVGSAWR